MSNHDKNGRFATGNTASPGRPRRATEMQYVDAVINRCTPEVWDTIVARAVMNAQDGDRAAREWLERYLIGAPPAMTEVPLEDLKLFTYIVRSLQERGGDVNTALRMLVDQVNADIEQNEHIGET